MAAFPMCEKCAAEYADPLDRRFHAQPDACFECGPSVTWRVGADGPISLGKTREESDAIFAAAVEMLMAGKILAVKGLGGFHLVCDADESRCGGCSCAGASGAMGKALGVVMAQGMGDVRALLRGERRGRGRFWRGRQRPIVLLRKRPGACYRRRLGRWHCPNWGSCCLTHRCNICCMHDFAESEWYAANRGAWHEAEATEPATPGAAACDDLGQRTRRAHLSSPTRRRCAKLAGIADAFLGNNRPILTRFDDSVVRADPGGCSVDEKPVCAIQFAARGLRGYAPVPDVGDGARRRRRFTRNICSRTGHSIFAAGPEQKNTFTLHARHRWRSCPSTSATSRTPKPTTRGWPGEGSLRKRCSRSNPDRSRVRPASRVPHKSKWAHQQSLPVTEVQHHHAHVVSVMAEHGLAGAVCGIAFDGTGYGDGRGHLGRGGAAGEPDWRSSVSRTSPTCPCPAARRPSSIRCAWPTACCGRYDLLDHPAAAAAL